MEEKKIAKSNWTSQFTLVGKPVIGDFTFEIDKHSNKSNYVYNRMKLGIDCGEKHGIIYSEMMGGYFIDNPRPIRVCSKTEDGKGTDFNSRIDIEWDERFNDNILSEVSNMFFIKVGLEETSADDVFVNRFLSEYDAIEYIKEHLTPDMVVTVRGNLQYSTYEGKTQVRKNIKSIYLKKNAKPSDYEASFIQTVLINGDSASLKDIDKEKGVMPVSARVLDYVKEYNGVDVKGQFPYNMMFEFKMPINDGEKCKKIYDKWFNIKKGVTQDTFEGEFIERGATIKPTWDDIPDDIKLMVELELWTKEQALAECSSNGAHERRMVMTRPYYKKANDDDGAMPVPQRFDERFEEDDLILNCMKSKDSTDNNEDSDDYASWLANL